MSLVVTLEAKVKPEFVERVKELLTSMIPETRAFEGCINIDIHENIEEKGAMMFHEKWSSKSLYEKYFSWRLKSDSMKELSTMLISQPEVRFYECLDI